MSEAKRQTGVSIAVISLCCHGKSKTAGGFIWMFPIKQTEIKTSKEDSVFNYMVQKD